MKILQAKFTLFPYNKKCNKKKYIAKEFFLAYFMYFLYQNYKPEDIQRIINNFVK